MGSVLPIARSRRSHATIGSAANVNWVTRCMSRPRSRAMRFFAANAHVQLVVGDVGMPLRVARDADAADAGLLEAAGVEDLRRLVELADRVPSDPAMSSSSSTPDGGERRPACRRKAARSGTPRAAMCGTGRIPASATHRDRRQGLLPRHVRQERQVDGRAGVQELRQRRQLGVSRGVISTLNGHSPQTHARRQASSAADSDAKPQARRRRISALIAGHDLVQVADDGVVALVTIGASASVLIARIVFELEQPGPVLDGAADAAGDVEVGRDPAAGLADLLVVRPPAEAGHHAGDAERAVEQLGELEQVVEPVGAAGPAAGADHDPGGLEAAGLVRLRRPRCETTRATQVGLGHLRGERRARRSRLGGRGRRRRSTAWPATREHGRRARAAASPPAPRRPAPAG